MALNDFFQDSPNYINPDYATPAQRAQQRTYAEMLMKRSSGDVTRPTGAIANIIDALTGRLEMNRAGNLEQQALSHSTDQNAALIAALQGQGGGQQQANASPPPPTPNVGATPPMGGVGSSIVPSGPVTDPTNSPRGEVQPSPTVWGDKEAQAAGLYPPTQVASLSPAGGSAPSGGAQAPAPVLPTGAGPAAPMPPNQRVAQAFDPNLLAGTMNNQMSSPEAKALIGQLIGQKQGADVYGNPTREGIVGGVQRLPIGAGVIPGFRSETSISPTGISGVSVNPASNAQPGLQAGVGGVGGAMNTMNTLAMNAGKTGAVQEFQKQDLAAANDAPTIKRVAGTMLDELKAHGDKMTFGPTAEWSNNVKRVAANYLPGATKDSLEALASADSFDKMSAQLTGLLSKGGGTDAQLFNNIKSVPGSHNSKEGAEALLKMTLQVADQQQALAQAVSGAKTPEEYQQIKADFYKRNPIVNPITGNPIALDLKNNNGSGGASTLPIPEVGDVIQGHRFKGGNPADKANWEPFT